MKADINTVMTFVTGFAEGAMKGLLIATPPGMGVVTRTREILPDAPVFDLENVADMLGLIELHKFMSANADRKVIIDAGGFFDRQTTNQCDILTRNQVAMMFKDALDGRGEVGHLTTLDGFTFTGGIVIICRHRENVWSPVVNRMVSISLGE